MSDTFTSSDMRLMKEIADGFERHGYTRADIKKMASGDMLDRLLPVIRGNAEVTIVRRILNCSKQFDPIEFLGPGWKEVKKDRDERSFDLTEIDFENVLFEHCIKEGDTYITGEENLNRLKEMEDTIRLGSNVFLALWEDYKKCGERSVLKWLRSERGIEFIAFPGSPLHDPNGVRFVLSLYWYGLEWRWYYYWLGGGWDAGGLSALLHINS